MLFIEKTDALQKFLDSLNEETFITIDTEFMRDKTYYPKLCLIQIAGKNGHQALIDPLSDTLSLDPFIAFLKSNTALKVLHGARQDLEIFYLLCGEVPTHLYDTQIAAQLCGFGESIGYENLVKHYCPDAKIDKTSRFTDWSARPLSTKQLEYALSDVTYLRTVYEGLQNDIESLDRLSWVEEEMNVLFDETLYSVDPDKAWMRIKTRTDNPKFLAILKEIAKWREQTAQKKDIPRGRLMRDDQLLDIAASKPETPTDLERIRGISQGYAHSKNGEILLEAIKLGIACPPKERPKREKKKNYPDDIKPAVELLKMLLRLKAEEHGVAARILCEQTELYELAHGVRKDLHIMEGWRYDLFGETALKLLEGALALKLDQGVLKFVASSP